MSVAGPSQDKSDEVIFFLGASASVKADVPDTFGLVDEFKKAIADDRDKIEAINKVLEILHGWKNQKADVELLLETLDKLENREEEAILRFYKDGRYVLSGYADKTPLKEVRGVGFEPTYS